MEKEERNQCNERERERARERERGGGGVQIYMNKAVERDTETMTERKR